MLNFNLEGVKVFHKLENQIYCTKTILKNVNAEIIKYNTLNDPPSAVLLSTPEFNKNSAPFLYGK